MEKKIDLFALRAHIEGCIWPQSHKFSDEVGFASRVTSNRIYSFVLRINEMPDYYYFYEYDSIDSVNSIIGRLNSTLKDVSDQFDFIPPFQQESEGKDGKKRMSVSMNGIRKNLYQNMYYLTKNLNRSNDNGTIHVEAEDIQSSMDGLRGGIGALLCVYMDDREDFTDQSDLLDDFPWFNEESEAGND